MSILGYSGRVALFVTDHGKIGTKYVWDNRDHGHLPSAYGMQVRTWREDRAPLILRVTLDEGERGGGRLLQRLGCDNRIAPDCPYGFFLLYYRESKRHLFSLWACVAALAAYKRSDEGTRAVEDAKATFLATPTVQARPAVLAGFAGDGEEGIVRREGAGVYFGKTYFAKLLFEGMNEGEVADQPRRWGPGRSFGATRRW